MEKSVTILQDVKRSNQSQDYDNSFKMLTQLLTEDPSNPMVRIYLGMTYLERGLNNHDVEDFEKAQELFTLCAEMWTEGTPIGAQDLWDIVNWAEYLVAAHEKLGESVAALNEKLDRALHLKASEPKAKNEDRPWLN